MRRIIALLLMIMPLPAWAEDCVVLLHGLGRAEASLVVMEETLELEGYRAFGADYPSTDARIAELAEVTLPGAVQTCGGRTIHFVTHSMGGILLRVFDTFAITRGCATSKASFDTQKTMFQRSHDTAALRPHLHLAK